MTPFIPYGSYIKTTIVIPENQSDWVKDWVVLHKNVHEHIFTRIFYQSINNIRPTRHALYNTPAPSFILKNTENEIVKKG